MSCFKEASTISCVAEETSDMWLCKHFLYRCYEVFNSSAAYNYSHWLSVTDCQPTNIPHTSHSEERYYQTTHIWTLAKWRTLVQAASSATLTWRHAAVVMRVHSIEVTGSFPTGLKCYPTGQTTFLNPMATRQLS